MKCFHSKYFRLIEDSKLLVYVSLNCCLSALVMRLTWRPVQVVPHFSRQSYLTFFCSFICSFSRVNFPKRRHHVYIVTNYFPSYFPQVWSSNQRYNSTRFLQIRYTGVQHQIISSPQSLRGRLGKAAGKWIHRGLCLFFLKWRCFTSQMLQLATIRARSSVHITAAAFKQPHPQSLYSAESCWLHAIQSAQLLSTPADAARWLPPTPRESRHSVSVIWHYSPFTFCFSWRY